MDSLVLIMKLAVISSATAAEPPLSVAMAMLCPLCAAPTSTRTLSSRRVARAAMMPASRGGGPCVMGRCGENATVRSKIAVPAVCRWKGCDARYRLHPLEKYT